MTLAATDYPQDFPCASRDGYALQVGLGLLRTPEGAPVPLQRRQNANMATTFAVMFEIPVAMLFRWQDWVNKFGYHWFNLTLAHPYMPANTLVEKVPVKFTSGTLSLQYQTHALVAVSVELELHSSVFAESDF